MSSLAPSVTSNLVVQAPYALLPGSATTGRLRSTTNLDLRTKIGGKLWIGLGWYHASGTAMGAGVNVAVTPIVNGGSGVPRYAAPIFEATSDLTGEKLLINAVSGYAAGVQSIAWNDEAGTDFAPGNKLCLWGVNTAPAAEGVLTFAGGCYSEIVKVSYGTVTGGSPFITNQPTGMSQPDDGLISRGNSWVVDLPGGAAYALTFDAGSMVTAGVVMVAFAHAEVYTLIES